VTRPEDIIDDEIAGVIDETITTLVLLRDRGLDTNAAAELDAVATLIRHAQSRLPDLVADARDQATRWTSIAELLGVTRTTAVARYALHAHNRRQPLETD
jgi:P2-related tail formation protein